MSGQPSAPAINSIQRAGTLAIVGPGVSSRRARNETVLLRVLGRYRRCLVPRNAAPVFIFHLVAGPWNSPVIRDTSAV